MRELKNEVPFNVRNSWFVFGGFLGPYSKKPFSSSARLAQNNGKGAYQIEQEVQVSNIRGTGCC